MLAPVVIGAGSTVEAGTTVGPYAVLGNNVRIRTDAHIERSVIHDNVYGGVRADVRGAIVGRGCNMRNSVRLADGVVLGEQVVLGAECVVSQDVKVYPSKTVEAGAVVNSSIVWESKGVRSLFGRDGSQCQGHGQRGQAGRRQHAAQGVDAGHGGVSWKVQNA